MLLREEQVIIDIEDLKRFEYQADALYRMREENKRLKAENMQLKIAREYGRS